MSKIHNFSGGMFYLTQLMQVLKCEALDETESNIQFIASGQGKLSPILFCTGAINWMFDEVKSNKCFIIPKTIGSNKLVVWNRLVPTKVTLT